MNAPHPSPAEILKLAADRPWPVPRRPWIMFQRWNDLLFAHWALPPEHIRPLVPPELQLDLFQGKAWVAITPFWMSRIHLRGLPPLPGLSKFPEMNLRTYVRLPHGRNGADNGTDKAGVFFFSLDAGSIPAVLAARLAFGLPYYWSRMMVTQSAPEQIAYESIRRQSPKPADVRVRYAPVAPVLERKNELEAFLTERYCLYVVRRGRVFRAEIHHLPWSLQPAQAEFQKNTVAARHGIHLAERPELLHFSRQLDVLIFPPERIS